MSQFLEASKTRTKQELINVCHTNIYVHIVLTILVYYSVCRCGSRKKKHTPNSSMQHSHLFRQGYFAKLNKTFGIDRESQGGVNSSTD